MSFDNAISIVIALSRRNGDGSDMVRKNIMLNQDFVSTCFFRESTGFFRFTGGLPQGITPTQIDTNVVGAGLVPALNNGVSNRIS